MDNIEEIQADESVRVIVFQVHERLTIKHVDPDFLVKFANQREFCSLTRHNLAAWKFPHALKRAAADAFGNQYASLIVGENPRHDVKTNLTV